MLKMSRPTHCGPSRCRPCSHVAPLRFRRHQNLSKQQACPNAGHSCGSAAQPRRLCVTGFRILTPVSKKSPGGRAGVGHRVSPRSARPLPGWRLFKPTVSKLSRPSSGQSPAYRQTSDELYRRPLGRFATFREAITPMARSEWVRWVNATKNPDTRERRVAVSLSKLSSGKRRPCCFNLAACTDPDFLSKNGQLVPACDDCPLAALI